MDGGVVALADGGDPDGRGLLLESSEPELSVWNVRERLEENFRRVEALLEEMARDGDARVRLAAAAELRHHIGLAEKTLRTAIRAEAVLEFEDVVLAALEQASA